MAKKQENIANELPQISILILSVLIVYWSFGQKATFYYTLVMALSIIMFRQKEIRNLFVNDIVKIFN
jgi:hypothetical protein